jgi:hypothetical protein
LLLTLRGENYGHIRAGRLNRSRALDF